MESQIAFVGQIHGVCFVVRQFEFCFRDSAAAARNALALRDPQPSARI
jgi:hypothetical protein